jgi:hypothetical protein
MRLFEVAGNQFQDDLANVLKVMQGRANSKNTTSIIPWQAINNMLSAQGYANINHTMIDKIKDKIDPKDELIQNYDDKGITLKTNVASPEEPKPVGGQSAPKSIDQMARNAAKDSLK